ncbi:MAG: lipoprotein [Rhodospirillales bacterium]
MRRLFIIALVLVAVSACGKKGDLKHPENSNATYPRTYPSR